MKIAKFVLPVIAAGFAATSVSAAITADNVIGTAGGGQTTNQWSVTTDTDYLSAVVFVTLDTGTVYDPFAASLTLDGDSLAISDGDTYFTANGNALTGIAGGAGDLGHVHPTTPGDAEVGPTVLGVAWFSPGASTGDIGSGMDIGRFSFSADATGVWQLLVINAADEQTLLSGTVAAGAMVPEPASLALLGLGGLAVLRRR
jgi:PEP-CTERM motif-containing protein